MFGQILVRVLLGRFCWFMVGFRFRMLGFSFTLRVVGCWLGCGMVRAWWVLDLAMVGFSWFGCGAGGTGGVVVTIVGWVVVVLVTVGCD